MNLLRVEFAREIENVRLRERHRAGQRFLADLKVF
jgi:hypothetical protein